GVGPEDHPLLVAVQGEAVVEQLRALLAPIAAPVAAAGGAEAIEAGKDVEGVGGGHDALLGCVDRSWIQTGTHGKTHRGLTSCVRPEPRSLRLSGGCRLSCRGPGWRGGSRSPAAPS